MILFVIASSVIYQPLLVWYCFRYRIYKLETIHLTGMFDKNCIYHFRFESTITHTISFHNKTDIKFKLYFNAKVRSTFYLWGLSATIIDDPISGNLEFDVEWVWCFKPIQRRTILEPNRQRYIKVSITNSIWLLKNLSWD